MPRAPRPHPLRSLQVVPKDQASDLSLGVPEPPRGLSDKSQQAWIRLWSSPIARVMLPQLDAETIEMLLRMRDERDTEFRLGKRQRMVIGSQGQPVINPLISHAIVMQKEIRALEDRLGLNPAARLKLGVLLGDATRSIADVNEEFEQGEFSDVDLSEGDDDSRPAGRRTG
jgi:P27 family predicted phage terminase small subunit